MNSAAGDIGKYIVTIRRSGSDWYIRAMTDEKARTVTVPLDFLTKSNYEARIWQDGDDINRLRFTRQSVVSGNSLALTLAPSGGCRSQAYPEQ